MSTNHRSIFRQHSIVLEAYPLASRAAPSSWFATVINNWPFTSHYSSMLLVDFRQTSVTYESVVSVPWNNADLATTRRSPTLCHDAKFQWRNTTERLPFSFLSFSIIDLPRSLRRISLPQPIEDKYLLPRHVKAAHRKTRMHTCTLWSI